MIDKKELESALLSLRQIFGSDYAEEPVKRILTHYGLTTYANGMDEAKKIIDETFKK